ncbi:hypothetical protein LLG95_03580 [bacterium]|nr:hypothetical protein [bacterium]
MILELNPEEAENLLRLVEAALADTRVEVRRTDNPEWKDELSRHEKDLAALRDRLQLLRKAA